VDSRHDYTLVREEPVSARVRWIFLRLEAEDGGFGLGEIAGAEPATAVVEPR
jgi:hypothetical protein